MKLPNLQDYTFTPLRKWAPGYPCEDDSPPVEGQYCVRHFEHLSDLSDAQEALEAGNLYLDIPHCSGGDYSGATALERSNCLLFAETFGTLPGVVGYYGDYGIFGIVVKLSTIEAETDQAAELRDTLAGLEKYPLIDDEHHSLLEMEITKECYGDHHDDATRYLERRYDPCEDEDEEATQAWEAMDNLLDSIDYQVFMRELTILGIEMGEEWVNESPTSSYLDIEKILDSMDYAETMSWLKKTGGEK